MATLTWLGHMVELSGDGHDVFEYRRSGALLGIGLTKGRGPRSATVSELVGWLDTRSCIEPAGASESIQCRRSGWRSEKRSLPFSPCEPEVAHPRWPRLHSQTLHLLRSQNWIKETRNVFKLGSLSYKIRFGLLMNF